jgi:excinuclease UvrABC ATPase subunit
MVLATVVEGRKGEYSTLLNELAGQGFSRVRVDGVVLELAERDALTLARYEQHTIDVVLDRLTVKRRTVSASPSRWRRRSSSPRASSRSSSLDPTSWCSSRRNGLQRLRDQLQ